MAAIPVKEPSKSKLQDWLDLTAQLLSDGALSSTDQIGASEAAGARAKVKAERDAR